MFRKELPRVYELRDLIEDPNSPKAYFQNLDKFLRDDPSKTQGVWQVWLKREKALQGLDPASWEFLKKEASPYLVKKDETKGRGWQQLINILNQAWAYNYLKTIVGCSNIHFIPRSINAGEETPDLYGILGSIETLCEVKTVNISDKEAQRRRNGAAGETKGQLEPVFFSKLMSVLSKAKRQLEMFNAEKEGRRIVYLIVNYDDSLHEYEDRYCQQIDRFLSTNTISGIEIVYHHQASLFHKTITMKSVFVFNE